MSFAYPRLDSSLIFGFIVADVILLVLGAYSIIRLGRRLVLEADKEAAEALGTASLTEVLRKLEVLREHDASRGNDWPEYGDNQENSEPTESLRRPRKDCWCLALVSTEDSGLSGHAFVGEQGRDLE